MISKNQINELDKLLGQAIRISISIEFNINLIYCFVKTLNVPMCLQDNNFNIYKNQEFNKIWKNSEDKDFNTTLKLLKEYDKENKIFTIKQYIFLNDIRKQRNKICHEMTCPYLHWKCKDDEIQVAFQKDIKKLKRFISDANQYDNLVKNKINILTKPKDIQLKDCIKITGVKFFKLDK